MTNLETFDKIKKVLNSAANNQRVNTAFLLLNSNKLHDCVSYLIVKNLTSKVNFNDFSSMIRP